MAGQDPPIPPSTSKRSVLGCRVSQDVQDDFAEFVTEHFDNRKGAFGYCVEQAMREYMDNDRYHRMDDRIGDVAETVAETNALVRRIITAEKEKGAFLEAAPKGNQAGDRVERENAVVGELVRRCIEENHSIEFSEAEVNDAIADVAQVASEPSKRDYRESFIERGLIEPAYSKHVLTEAAFRMHGHEIEL